MDVNQRGLFLRSNPETFQAGATIAFKMDFLQAARHMSAPEVWEADLIFTGTVGGVTATALGRDAAKLFDKVNFKDSGDVLNCSGAGLRVLEQLELGQKQVDPATVASGSSNANYVYRLRLPFGVPYRAIRPRDFTIPISNFLDGGEFSIACAANVPTGWNVPQADWKVRLVFYVQDGRVKELKSRRRIKEEAMTQQEYDYQVNGFLRTAVISSKLTTTGYTDLSAITQLDSRTLRFPAGYETYNLVDDYRYSAQSVATNDEFLLAANGALAVVLPEEGQKTGQMLDTKSLHIDLKQSAPTSARLITDVVVDRDGDMSALSNNYSSPDMLSQAVAQMGEIVYAGGSQSIKGANAQLARKLPIRIAPNR